MVRASRRTGKPFWALLATRRGWVPRQRGSRRAARLRLAGRTFAVEIEPLAGHPVAALRRRLREHRAQVRAVEVVDAAAPGADQVRMGSRRAGVVPVARPGELELGHFTELLEDAHRVVDGGPTGRAAPLPC